jgi:hypothetical protein
LALSLSYITPPPWPVTVVQAERLALVERAVRAEAAAEGGAAAGTELGSELAAARAALQFAEAQNVAFAAQVRVRCEGARATQEDRVKRPPIPATSLRGG